LFVAVVIGVVAPVRADEARTGAIEFFEAKIRPVLVERCFKCHSGARKKPKGGLRLDGRAWMLDGGDTGPAFVAGDPAKSLLIESLHYGDKSYKMPPDSKLSKSVIADFEKWIALGAPWPDAESTEPSKARGTKRAVTDEDRAFWSFRPVKRPELPAIERTAWVKNDVDRFIFAQLEERGLETAAAADKRVLIRRATYDLTGLPPTPEEVEAFFNDESPEAFSRVVDRLLDSPRYGERWARHWLDGVRYVSDAGYYNFSDLGWRYRDWVIRALNRDMPYDEFVRMQIAGDLVPTENDDDYADGIVATGVLAMGNIDDQETDREKLYANVIDDQIDLVSRQFLGLTVSCARCHDHKFDPIPTEDYYALGGIFLSSRVLNTKGRIGAPRLKISLDRPGGKGGRGEAIGAQDGGQPDGRHREIGDMHLYVRGNPFKLGPVVPRRFLRVIAGDDQVPIGERTKQSGRLELARWIAGPENPLTARVLVNRLWLYHFGEGIVTTPSNFGSRGARPSHPGLLDYLADELVRSKWSMKAMHRLIMNSATYQLSVRAESALISNDPDNRLFGRFRSRRLSAEELYDTLLAVSGRLEGELGQGKGNRAIYARIGHAHTFLPGALFDAPAVGTIVSKRSESTTAPQALFFLNDEKVVAASRGLADRVEKSAEPMRERIELAYRLGYSRAPTPRELAVGETFLSKLDASERWTYFQVLLCANELAYLY